ncbi:MAG: beta-galactosidase, partial [Muribaculaceae bacterium]|nr:beta-galactosidase [Muribaculaceae bacterium]
MTLKTTAAHVLASVMLTVPVMAGAQTFKEWQDPQINAVNRMPMHTSHFGYRTAEEARAGKQEESANYMTLQGMWKFNWVNNANQRPTDFYRLGFNDSGWDSIPVPGNWELYGYGVPLYVNTGYAWKNDFKSNPPHVPEARNHVGSYRRTFTVPDDCAGKQV